MSLLTKANSVFKVDDMVAWESQAGGFSKKKTGKIVAVIPPGKNPVHDKLIPAGLQLRGPGLGVRSEVSYLVQVRKSINLFWIHTKHLRKSLERQD